MIFSADCIKSRDPAIEAIKARLGTIQEMTKKTKTHTIFDKNITQNTVTLVQGKEHPLLFHRSVTTKHIHWLTNHPLPLECYAKVRYRQKEQKCLIEQKNCFYHITFNEKQRAATPGQSIVFYHNNICIGGGIIN